MKDDLTKIWNKRYSEEDYAYGTEPNEFLREKLNDLNPKSILFPAEGEGRNAIYAATLGWKVDAFDISDEGKRKALKLAENKKVNINYRVGNLQELGYEKEQFNTIALIFAHFPATVRMSLHSQLSSLLKSNGIIIFEGFSKKHLTYREKNPNVGGPGNIDQLFSEEELRNDFFDYDFLFFEETEIELSEGKYHNGTGSVIRFVAKKK